MWFHTNTRELMHSAIRQHMDVVFVCVTFLDNNVPTNHARVCGYSPWVRKDHSTQGVGVAFCHKDTLNVQVIAPLQLMPRELKMLVIKISDSNAKQCSVYWL